MRTEDFVSELEKVAYSVEEIDGWGDGSVSDIVIALSQYDDDHDNYINVDIDENIVDFYGDVSFKLEHKPVFDLIFKYLEEAEA